MLAEERRRFLLLFALHLAWGLVLLASISKYGLGVSTDAVHIMFAARNLAAGQGLVSYDGSFLVSWPPLYPVLLAALHEATGLAVLTAAATAQILAYLGLSVASAFLFTRIFRDHLGLAVCASLLGQVGSVMVLGFGMVGSDYVHLALVMVALALLGVYLRTGSSRAYVWLAVAGMLAALQRYVGVAIIATAVLAIASSGRGESRKKLLHSAVLAATAIPAGVWLFFVSGRYDLRGPLTFSENFKWFSRSLLEWFSGPIPADATPIAGTVLFWLGLALFAAAALLLGRGRRGAEGMMGTEARASLSDSWTYLWPILLYGLIYTACIFASASITYFNKLGGRFLLPLYIPLVALVVYAVQGVLDRAARSRGAALRVLLPAAGYAVIAALELSLLQVSFPVIRESTLGGVAGGDNAYNNSRWHEDPVLIYWKKNAPSGEYTLFSNDPDGAAFHTQHSVVQAPKKRAGPYSTAEIPVRDYVDTLFSAGREVYLYWVEDAARDYYYAPTEIEQIAEVRMIFSGSSGGIYSLRPKGGS